MTTTTAAMDKVPQPAEGSRPPRQQRVSRYKVWHLQKRLAELSGQVEAAVIEARQLVAWKQSCQPLSVAELSEEDRRILEGNRRARLVEVVQKHCSAVLKTIMQHKWAFPFNTPVDTQRFPDYPRIVSTPMDFSTVKARTDSGYYRDPKDWWADVMLVFANAKRYNQPGSDCHLMAQTLQETCEEKYDKVIGPRMAEEATIAQRDEMLLRKRRAELLNSHIGDAMDAQCSLLCGLMAELQAAIRDAKSLAASLCDPVTLEEKQALAASIQALPTSQLEAVVAFVASRHPPSVSQSEAPGGGAVSRKVQLNLGRYDALLLRQLQHLVGTCNAATGQTGARPAVKRVVQQAGPAAAQQASKPPGVEAAAGLAGQGAGGAAGAAASSAAPGSLPAGVAPVAEQQPAAVAPPGGTGQAAGASGQAAAVGGTASGTGAAAEGPAKLEASSQQQQPSQGPAAGSQAGASGAAADAKPQAAAPAQPDPPAASAAAKPEATPHAGAATAPPAPAATAPTPSAAAAPTAAQAAAPAAAPAAASAAAPGPGPAAAPAPAPSSTQRNIADVVTNATGSGVSLRAGIRWPGQAVGAGIRPRARALLSLNPHGPSSAGELVAACPLPRVEPRVGGKRKLQPAGEPQEGDAGEPAPMAVDPAP